MELNYNTGMETITIPKKLSKKGELVLISKKDYESLLKVHRWKEDLDKSLDKSIAQYRRGQFIGPFRSVAQLKKSLEK